MCLTSGKAQLLTMKTADRLYTSLFGGRVNPSVLTCICRVKKIVNGYGNTVDGAMFEDSMVFLKQNLRALYRGAVMIIFMLA
jgi:hypothetical protein